MIAKWSPQVPTAGNPTSPDAGAPVEVLVLMEQRFKAVPEANFEAQGALQSVVFVASVRSITIAHAATCKFEIPDEVMAAELVVYHEFIVLYGSSPVLSAADAQV